VHIFASVSSAPTGTGVSVAVETPQHISSNSTVAVVSKRPDTERAMGAMAVAVASASTRGGCLRFPKPRSGQMLAVCR